MVRSLLWLTMIGCGSSAPEEDEQQAVAQAAVEAEHQAKVTRFGWVSEVADDPQRFADLTATGREGWIALHAHDYVAAVESFGDDHLSRSRSEFALAVLYDDLARLSGLANEALYSEWDQRSGLPEGNAAPLMAALSSHCADGDTTAIWAGRVSDGDGFQTGMALVQGRSPFDASGTGSLVQRLGQHRDARRGEVNTLTAESLQPLMVVEDGDITREFWDPCIYRSLSDGWYTRTAGSLEGGTWRAIKRWADEPGLGGRLFAPWPTSEDLSIEITTATEAGIVGARSPTMRRLGMGSVSAAASDDPEAAREEVRALDQGLDLWRAELIESSPQEGQALLSELMLIERFRQEWLLTRARSELLGHRPQQALAILELARDKTTRSIGPRNAPALMALMSEAHLTLGHAREALDPLHTLVDSHPEVLGLRETVADLAVLRGVDRTGDSKEAQ